MKKAILILIAGLLLSSNANAYRGNVWDYLRAGMNKKEFRKVVDGGTSYGNAAQTGGIAVDYNLSKEITEMRSKYGWKYIGRVFRYYAYSEYFPEYNTEILSHMGWWKKNKTFVEGFGMKKAPESWVYYVFENVTKPKKCKSKSKSWVFCKGTLGNGTFKTIVFSKNEALAIANPEFAKKLEEEKKAEKAAIEATKKAQKEAYEAYEKQRKAKEKKKAEEKRIAEEKAKIAEEKAKKEEYERLEAKHGNKCKDFKKETPEYKNCILDTEKQEIAKAEAEKRIAEEKKKAEEEKIAREKKLTEIDPDLIPIATGSGFFISSDGHVITNEHVAGICEIMQIKVDGKKHHLNVVVTDQVNDLGLLKGFYKHPKYLEIDIEGPELGEEIVAMGYPLGSFTGAGVKITRGIVSSLSGPGNNYSEFQIDAAIGPGSSGGPIINKSGQVVGIAYGGINKMKAIKEQEHIPENVNFAISSQILTNFLKANKVQHTKVTGGEEYNTQTIAQIGDAATVQLYCLNTEEFYLALKKAETHTDVLLDLQ